MKAMVILGNRLLTHQLPAELKSRLDVAVRVLGEMDVDLIIPTGGRTNQGIDESESAAMARYLIGSGVEPHRILLEEKAMDTIGNAIFSRLALDSYRDCSEVVVVTSCYHVNRSKFIFENAYGRGYSLDFSHCAGQTLVRDDEAASLVKAQEFFRGVQPGDVQVALRKLLASNVLYGGLGE